MSTQSCTCKETNVLEIFAPKINTVKTNYVYIKHIKTQIHRQITGPKAKLTDIFAQRINIDVCPELTQIIRSDNN